MTTELEALRAVAEAARVVYQIDTKGYAGLSNALLQLRDTLASLVDAEKDYGWRPIETAPKDGTSVDLWCEFLDGGKREADCQWHTGHSHWIDRRGYQFLVPILHWRPLPPPPRAREGDGE